MSKASATKDILLYLLNDKMAEYVSKCNKETDLHRKTIINVEIIKIKDLADKLEHSK